jgi:hypothetical protein
MQSIATLSREGFTKLAEFVFESRAPVVFHAYSAYGQPLRSFRKPSEFTADIESAFATGQKSLHFALHYPDTKGHVAERKITLDPKKCAGHTWRYTVEGWGLIQFQGDLRRAPAIECRIAVNTQKRAEAWASTYPEFKDPDFWDWKAVQLHAGRIIRRMKNIAELSRWITVAEQGAAGQPQWLLSLFHAFTHTSTSTQLQTLAAATAVTALSRSPYRQPFMKHEPISRSKLRAQISVQPIMEGVGILCPVEVSERFYQHFLNKNIPVLPPVILMFNRYYPLHLLKVSVSLDVALVAIRLFVESLPDVCYERDVIAPQ